MSPPSSNHDASERVVPLSGQPSSTGLTPPRPSRQRRNSQNSSFNLMRLFRQDAQPASSSHSTVQPPVRRADRRDSGFVQGKQVSETRREREKRLHSLSRNSDTTLLQPPGRSPAYGRPRPTASLPTQPDTNRRFGRAEANPSDSRFTASTDIFSTRRNRTQRDFTVIQSKEPTQLGDRTRRSSAQKESWNQSRRSSPEGRASGGMDAEQRNSPPRERASRPKTRQFSAVLYATRMIILSIGVGVLAGTVMSVWDPASRAPAGASQQAAVTASASGQAQTSPAPAQLQLGSEIAPLKSAIQTLVAQNSQLTPGIFLLDLDTNAYLDLNGGASLPAASTIKVPILIAFFQDVDAGKIRLDELLTMRSNLVATGSGDMQYQPTGSQYTALETVTKMIVISDNTATNMIIARLGGVAALNQRFQSWGMSTTALNNLLPDIEGTNLLSSKDATLLMARLSQGELVSMRSRDRILDIMRKTVNNSLLPTGLDEGATIAHKTGNLGIVVGDVGLIDLPNGKRYAISVLVKRPFDDGSAPELIQQISRTSYQYFNRSSVPANSARTGQTPSN